MDEVEVQVQVEMEWAEVVHTRKAGDGKQSVDDSEDEAKTARPIRIPAQPCKERNDSAEKVKSVMRGWKGEIEHFVAKEAGDANDDQYETA